LPSSERHRAKRITQWPTRSRRTAAASGAIERVADRHPLAQLLVALDLGVELGAEQQATLVSQIQPTRTMAPANAP
jgi:hypothetical protein